MDHRPGLPIPPGGHPTGNPGQAVVYAYLFAAWSLCLLIWLACLAIRLARAARAAPAHDEAGD